MVLLRFWGWLSELFSFLRFTGLQSFFELIVNMRVAKQNCHFLKALAIVCFYTAFSYIHTAQYLPR